MRANRNLFSFLIVIAAGLAGCSQNSQKSDGGGRRIDAAAILANGAMGSAEKAQRLADTAEQLLSAQGFDYANDVADLALAQDSKNAKAQLIKALLAPIMVQRGVVVRVAPLAQLDPHDSGYAELRAQVDALPRSTVKTFLLDGQPNIKDESDIQTHFDAMAGAFGKIREFAKTNKDARITMRGTDSMYQTLVDRQAQVCEIQEGDRYVYSTSCPTNEAALETMIDRADLEVIQQYAAGMELYLSLYNSYDLSGVIKVAQDNAGGASTDVLDQLLAHPKFGTLRAGNGLTKIKSIGTDAIMGLRWIMANQSKLCPTGYESPRNRIGALVNNGICVNPSAQKEIQASVRKVEAALQGERVPLQVPVARGVYHTALQPSMLLDHPIADLRSLTPQTTNACGGITGLADPSLGGLFPNRDFNVILNQGTQCR